jgi:hypothetical protein
MQQQQLCDTAITLLTVSFALLFQEAAADRRNKRVLTGERIRMQLVE